MNNSATRGIERIRHEMRMRLLTVKRVTSLTPSLVRITLTGDLQGFTSASYDDHVKLFFPEPGETQPVLPKGPPGSPAAAAGPTPIMRDYTPRRFDLATQELDIDFVLHGEGPATTWASSAQPGQTLGIGGPRGSFILTGEFDWYLFVADEAGLPAIARRLEELPAQAHCVVVAEVESAHHELQLRSQSHLQVHWVHRQGQDAGQSTILHNTLQRIALPAGDGYTWIACESSVARTLRNYLIGERGFDKQWIKAAGYWKHGAAATHDKHED